MDLLQTSLLDLLFELRGRQVPIIIGGGFGLFLKRRHLTASGQRTLFARLPEVRSTNDLDLFIRAEVLADLGRTRLIAQTLRGLGYQPVEEAKFLQWKRAVLVAGRTLEVKVDLLVGPLGPHRPRLRVKSPRVRPRGEVELHAHCTEEALGIEDGPMEVLVTGARSNGEACQGTVGVPRAFPYLMMKLHAFADRRDDARKDAGRHHALDLYTIVGLMTAEEYDDARRLGAGLGGDVHVRRAREVVAGDFAATTALGVLRLREHPLFRPDFQVDDFIAVLGEIFPRGS
jgi:hypothetical protein